MTNIEEQQVIGLAAMVQALSLVQSVAIKGQFDNNTALPVFYSLINYNPESASEAYNNDTHALGAGFSQLKKLFSDDLDKDLAQYMLAVITLERKLVANPQMRQTLQRQLQEFKNELSNEAGNTSYHQVFDDNFDDDFDDDFGSDLGSVKSENIDNQTSLNEVLTAHDTIERFAKIYKETASHTEPRIMVKGNHQFLQSETSANQIRALLLAALRGAAFFRHYGGKRVDFMLKRKQYLNIIENLY
ncbi:MAG: DUF489 family protein [Gammaproteobacteria bacterium]|nr:DUF489 family protein [Gammaproteobacteria bacterium]